MMFIFPMSEVTSNSNPKNAQWQRFTYTLLSVMMMALALSYLFIIIIDPFDNLLLSPDLKRVQVKGIDRDFKPSLARRPQYDSVVIGSSSSMLLHPGRLSKAFGARFTTLAMPAASPYEQDRLLALFHRHHPAPRYVIMGVDRFWCELKSVPKQIGYTVGQPMRDWLYDENRWNNWPGLTSKMLKYTRRQVQSLLDPNPDPSARDGYYNFTVEDYGSYDLNRARNNIYGQQQPILRPKHFKLVNLDTVSGQGSMFPEVERLGNRLAALPSETVKLVLFPPYHWYRLFQMGKDSQYRLAECKLRIAALGERLDNYHVLDFMRLSPISIEDSHYWDREHYNTEIAKSMEIMISDAVLRGRRLDDYYTYLWPPLPHQN